MNLIGIDIGSSFIKGGALDLDARQVRDIVREPFPAPVSDLPSGHFEIEPLAVVAAVERVVRELLTLAPDAVGVMFCGQMGGVILTDRDGQPQSNYLSWRDLRTTKPLGSTIVFDETASRLGDEELQAIGQELKPGSATTLLRWLVTCGGLPEHAVPLDIGDFVVGRLCGARPRFEKTQAIGLLDLATGNWRQLAFERLSIDQLDWPALTDFRTPIGMIAWQGRAIPCYPCVGDQQAALAGTLLAEGDLSLNISTGSQVSRLATVVRRGEFQTRPFFDGHWLNTITHLPAGRALDALVGLLTELPRTEGLALRNPWDVLIRAAEQADDSDLEVALTFFPGPLGNRGHIAGLTLENLTVGHVFRAALRSMAENYARCAQRLAPERDWSRVVFSGGLAQKLPLLREFIVARLDTPYRLCPTEEDTLFGLLVLGYVVTDRAASVAEAIARLGDEAANRH